MVQSQTYTDLTSSSSSSLFLRHIKSHEGLCRVALDKKTLEHANLGINLDDIPVSGGFRGGRDATYCLQRCMMDSGHTVRAMLTLSSFTSG